MRCALAGVLLAALAIVIESWTKSG